MDINTEMNKREQGQKQVTTSKRDRMVWRLAFDSSVTVKADPTVDTGTLTAKTDATVDTVDLTYELPLSYELSPLWLLKSLQFFTSLSKSMSTRENTLPLIGSPESSPTRRQNSLATSSSFFGEYHIFCSYVLET